MALMTHKERLHAIIVGSDQVWRPSYIADIDTSSYFLGFKGDFRRIAYAASFGPSVWTEPDRLPAVRRMVAQFDAVSLRETAGVDLCKTTLGRETCQLALDPTLVVDPSFYDEVAAEPEDTEPFVLVYALDGDPLVKKAVERALSGPAKGCAVKVLTLKDGDRTVDIPQWVRAFKDAHYVVTDSFHGTIFSILFRKPFACIGNVERGLDRFESLLNLLGLEDRLLLSEADLPKLAAPVPYDAVAPRLAALRQSSLTFLKDALEGPAAHHRRAPAPQAVVA